MTYLKNCVLAATIGLLPAAALAQEEPVTIRIGWNQTPGHMASLAYLDALQPDGEHAVLQNYGQTYIAEPIRFQGSTHQITALASDEVDVAALSSAALVYAINNANLDVKVIGDVLQESCEEGVYTQPWYVRADSGIETAADLEGKRIGTNAIGSASDMAVRAMLRDAGIADDEVTSVEMPFGQMPSFIQEGKVDMVGLLPAFEAEIAASDEYKRLFTMCEALGPTQTVMLVAKTDFIEENRDALVDMLADLMRVTRWYYDEANRDAALDLVAGVTGAPAAEFADWIFTLEGDQFRHPDLLPSIEGLQNAIDKSLEFGIIEEDLDGPVTDYVDLSLVEEAKAQLDSGAAAQDGSGGAAAMQE